MKRESDLETFAEMQKNIYPGKFAAAFQGHTYLIYTSVHPTKAMNENEKLWIDLNSTTLASGASHRCVKNYILPATSST